MNFSNLFNMENPVWRGLGKIWDAACLTILWLVFSLPVVTMGASFTAVNYAAMKILKDEDEFVAKQFFSSFKQNFKQSSLIWLGSVLAAAVLGVNLWFYYHIEHFIGRILIILLIVLTYLFLAILHYIFAVLARFSNSIKNLLILSFLLAMRNFGWTFFMVTASVCVFAVCIFYCAPLLIFSVGALALLDAWVLNPIFEQYIETNQLRK